MEIKYLGLIPYVEALNLMEQLHTEVANSPKHEGFLLVLQHPPTVTMGKRELLSDMKIPPEELKYKGVYYHKIDRGGSVTVHEPGQIVIYPIINLDYSKHTIRSFVTALEQAMIETCAHYDVLASRDKINAGVWVEKNKVGAVGIRVLNKVTKHGLAFNVINNLDTFSYIVPCGLRERGVINLMNLIKNTDNIENLENFYHKTEKLLANNVSHFLFHH